MDRDECKGCCICMFANGLWSRRLLVGWNQGGSEFELNLYMTMIENNVYVKRGFKRSKL